MARNVAVVVGLIMATVIVGYVAMPAFGAVFADNTITYEQVEGETVVVNDAVNSTATNVTQSDATYELQDANTTQTVTVANGTNETVTMTDGDVTVSLEDTSGGTGNAADTTTTTYSYDNTYGWVDGAASLVGALVVFALLGIGIVLAGPALNRL